MQDPVTDDPRVSALCVMADSMIEGARGAKVHPLSDVYSRLVRFDGLDEVSAKIEKLEGTRKKAERLRSGHEKLTVLKGQYETAKVQVEALDGFDPVVPPKDEAEKTASELAEARRLCTRLTRSRSLVEALDGFGDAEASAPPEANVDALRRLQMGRKKIRQLRSRIEPLQKQAERWREAAEVAQGMDPDLSLERKAKQIQQVVKLLRALRTEMVTSREQVESGETDPAECVAELEALEADLGEALGHYDDCPLCGVAIEHVHSDADSA